MRPGSYWVHRHAFDHDVFERPSTLPTLQKSFCGAPLTRLPASLLRELNTAGCLAALPRPCIRLTTASAKGEIEGYRECLPASATSPRLLGAHIRFEVLAFFNILAAGFM
jgi:hypothetical protein